MVRKARLLFCESRHFSHLECVYVVFGLGISEKDHTDSELRIFTLVCCDPGQIIMIFQNFVAEPEIDERRFYLEGTENGKHDQPECTAARGRKRL